MARMNWQKAKRPSGSAPSSRARPASAMTKAKAREGCDVCGCAGASITITTGPLTARGLVVRRFCSPTCAATGGFPWAGR